MNFAQIAGLILLANVFAGAIHATEKTIWRSVSFAILKFDGEAPKSWNLYHGEKRGWILVRLWKRYLLVSMTDEEAYDLDPQKLTPKGNALEWTDSELPDKPIVTSEWSARNVGPVHRVRFRFGKDGHILELQLPLKPNGQPAY